MNSNIRVRFAPSPTGALHIGGVRTALYNYLFAKQLGGTFILRIEDTDQNRYVAGAEEYITEALEWLGLKPDESPVVGGEYAPYRQSDRKEMYKKYALQLLESGNAYYAFDTSEELDQMRKRLEEAKANNTAYNAISRMQMKNSFTLSAEEVKERIAQNDPNMVIRFKMPLKEEVRFEDLVQGWQKFHSAVLDDKVLLKADGMPTYHLANVVDDYLMKITHVIRGKEWLPSTPLHVLLYQSLGWAEVMPQFVHLPLMLNPDGKGKLSKRKGKEYGFPVFPLTWNDPETSENITGFREEGYLPEALLNFLALIGWNLGTTQEIFSLEELISVFSFDKVQKAESKFDIAKAKWFNQQYLKGKTEGELMALFLKTLPENLSQDMNAEKAQQIVFLMKERITFPSDIWKDAPYLFALPEQYDEPTIQKKWKPDVVAVLTELKEAFKDFTSEWTTDKIHDFILPLVENKGAKLGQVMPVLRLALTGASGGPDLMGILAFLGKEESIKRIETAIHKIP
jgi:glutamyl-tRNA synthetase